MASIYDCLGKTCPSKLIKRGAIAASFWTCQTRAWLHRSKFPKIAWSNLALKRWNLPRKRWTRMSRHGYGSRWIWRNGAIGKRWKRRWATSFCNRVGRPATRRRIAKRLLRVRTMKRRRMKGLKMIRRMRVQRLALGSSRVLPFCLSAMLYSCGCREMSRTALNKTEPTIAYGFRIPV